MFAKVMAWWKRKWQERRDALMLERQVIVSFDNGTVSAAFPEGQRQKIGWDEIICVAIETNDSGPWAGGRCLVATGRRG